ncbi:threonine/serine exporter family protein [Staphylococcus aureus]
MLAARILLESGAEGTRVEDTMTRIAKNLVTVKVTALLQTLSSSLRYIRNRFLEYLELPLDNTNLIKISQANKISRQITNNEISLAKANVLLKIYVAKRDSSFPLKVLLQQ